MSLSNSFRVHIAWPIVLWLRKLLRDDRDTSWEEYKEFVKKSDELKPSGVKQDEQCARSL